MWRIWGYWAASCFRTCGAMLGWRVLAIFSNSARVMTVWQSALGLAVPVCGVSQAPLIVITGVAGGSWLALAGAPARASSSSSPVTAGGRIGCACGGGEEGAA